MVRKAMRIDLMCDKCFKPINTNEEHSAIPITDDVGNNKMFKGHVLCMQYLAKELSDIYNGDDE